MRIACLLDSDFEDSEFKQPYDAFLKEDQALDSGSGFGNDVTKGQLHALEQGAQPGEVSGRQAREQMVLGREI